MPTYPGYVWIEDAAREHMRSRGFLDGLIGKGQLTPYHFSGDRRLYLSREELARALAPQVGSPARRDDTEEEGEEEAHT